MYSRDLVHPTNPVSELAQRIRRFRASLRESQTAFGARFGATRLTVSKWESGTIPNGDHWPPLIEQMTAAEKKQAEETPYLFELPSNDVIELAVRMSPQASQTIHFEVRLRTKTG